LPDLVGVMSIGANFISIGVFALRNNEDNMPANGTKCCECGLEVKEKVLLKRLDKVIEDYKSKQGALIPVLQITQNMFGYLPESALKKISVELNKPFSEVAGVVGFYSFFSTMPRGEHLIRVCLGTACYVRGGKQVLDAVKKQLGIDVGETTPDRKFSLEVARCFGACGLAPAMMIDDDIHQRVKPAKIQEILNVYRKKSSKRASKAKKGAKR
jgi:NADH:ubiquinone oxidoreductase subunit E